MLSDPELQERAVELASENLRLRVEVERQRKLFGASLEGRNNAIRRAEKAEGELAEAREVIRRALADFAHVVDGKYPHGVGDTVEALLAILPKPPQAASPPEAACPMPNDAMQYLDEVKARCEAATKGPWEWDDHVGAVFHAGGECAADQTTVSDGLFIAHARTDLPRAIAALRIYDEAARDAIAEADALGAVATNVWAEMVETSVRAWAMKGLMTARGKATAALTGEEPK